MKLLELKNLTKSFGGVEAVCDCSLAAEKGKITALIGPNGAGKSTVFNLISGMLQPDGGQIIFAGGELNRRSVEEISNLGISRLFQEVKLFDNLTVEENLSIALSDRDTAFWSNLVGTYRYSVAEKARVQEVLDWIEMAEYRQKQARDLSYGQKKLVGIGRSVLNSHQLLMLDEPVAGVNPKLRQRISDILLKLKDKGETILLIEHDMNFTLNLADRVIVMEAGRVIFSGSPERVKKDRRVIEAYLGKR
jgi:ABC-type branched-subunit amino acid transport system ATPase component